MYKKNIITLKKIIVHMKKSMKKEKMVKYINSEHVQLSKGILIKKQVATNFTGSLSTKYYVLRYNVDNFFFIWLRRIDKFVGMLHKHIVFF